MSYQMPMTRALTAYLLSALLAVTGLTLAVGRGTQPDIGVEIAICSGVEVVTIRLGPDGEPLEERHLCPDAGAMFLAAFALPDQPMPDWQEVGLVGQDLPELPVASPELSPSARGPPLNV